MDRQKLIASILGLGVAALVAFGVLSAVRGYEEAAPPAAEDLIDQDRRFAESPVSDPSDTDADIPTPTPIPKFSADYSLATVRVGGQELPGGPLPAGGEVEVSMTAEFAEGAQRLWPAGDAFFMPMMLRTSVTGAEAGEAFAVAEKPLWIEDDGAFNEAARTGRIESLPGFTASVTGKLPERTGEWLFQVWRFEIGGANPSYDVVYELPVRVGE